MVFEILHKDGGMGDTDLYITSCLANINQTVIWCYTTQEQWLDETDTQVQQYKPDSTVSFKTAQESVDKTWYFFNLSTLPSRSIASKGTNSCQCDIYLNHLVLAKEASLSLVKTTVPFVFVSTVPLMEKKYKDWHLYSVTNRQCNNLIACSSHNYVTLENQTDFAICLNCIFINSH